MSVAGTCEICGDPPVEHTCERCGQLVCPRHFEAEVGMCSACVAELGGSDGGTREPADRPDGVDTYRF